MREIAPTPRGFDRDDTDELLGEVFLAVLALDRAYNWARLLAANCEPAMAELKNVFPDSPLRDGELDMMWSAIRARRNDIEHLEKRAEKHPDGYIGFRRGRLEISGLPSMGFDGERMWAGLLAQWSEGYLDPPLTDRDDEPSERPKTLDLKGLPAWLKG